MRAKRKVLIIPAALTITALAVTSCCKHHDITVEPAIVMGVSTPATKAAVENLPDLIKQSYDGSTGFGVFGYKNFRNTETNAITPTQLFDNTIVRPSSAEQTAVWNYQPTRYWDSNPNASYQFLAYWPYEETNVTETDKVVKLTAIPNWQPGALAKDYMTATQYGRYAGQDGFAANQNKVSFRFDHLLSRLVIKGFYIGTEQDTVTVTGFSLQESATGAGDVLIDGTTDFIHDFSVASNTTLQDNSAGADKSDFGSSYALLHDSLIGIPKISFVNEMLPEPRDTVRSTISSWLMVPHAWNGVKLTISYKIAQGLERTTDPIAITLGKQADNYYTKPGYTYVITLKFNTAGEGVTLQSVAVREWNDVDDVKWEVYNW